MQMGEKSDAAVRAAVEARVHSQYPEHEGHLPENKRQGLVPSIVEETSRIPKPDLPQGEKSRQRADIVLTPDAPGKEEELRPPAKKLKEELLRQDMRRAGTAGAHS